MYDQRAAARLPQTLIKRHLGKAEPLGTGWGAARRFPISGQPPIV